MKKMKPPAAPKDFWMSIEGGASLAELREHCPQAQAGYRVLCDGGGVDWGKAFEPGVYLVKFHDRSSPQVRRVTMDVGAGTLRLHAVDQYEGETLSLWGPDSGGDEAEAGDVEAVYRVLMFEAWRPFTGLERQCRPCDAPDLPAVPGVKVIACG